MERILMLVRYYSPHRGGNEQQCQLLAEYLAVNNFKITIVTERYSSKLLSKEIINGVNILRLTSINTFYNINKLNPRHFVTKVFRIVFYYLAEFSLMFNFFFFLRRNRKDYGILHIHQNNWIAFWGIIGVNNRIPVIIKDATLNGFNELRSMPLKNYMKKVIIRNGRFVAVSTDIKNNLLENGVKKENIFVIPNATAFPLESNAHHSQDIIFVGNFEQGSIKGLDTLLNSIIHVFKQNNESRLLIIGKGCSDPYIKALGNLSAFKHRVQFLGQIENPSYFYLNSFIFVLPSRSEGMSNALLEAMSYGMPCISTKVSGSNDLIEDRKNGLLIPIEDEYALADSILLLLNNKDLAEEMGRNARKTIEGFYIAKIVYKKYEALYKKLMNE